MPRKASTTSGSTPSKSRRSATLQPRKAHVSAVASIAESIRNSSSHHATHATSSSSSTGSGSGAGRKRGRPALYEIEKILDKRVDADGDEEYLVSWVGYDEKEATWEPVSTIAHDAPDIVSLFEEEYKITDHRVGDKGKTLEYCVKGEWKSSQEARQLSSDKLIDYLEDFVVHHPLSPKHSRSK
jgi:hypothetical protein